MIPNFKGLFHPKVVFQATFFLILHSVYHLEVVHIKGLLAVLEMLGDSRVMPLFLFKGAFVLLPAGITGSAGLANIDGVF